VELIVDDEHLGRSEAEWELRNLRNTLAPLQELDARRLIVVAPHPDDEVLGAGGLIQFALSSQIPIEIIAVTDGESSHPHSKASRTMDLASERRRESHLALQRLGWEEPVISHLHVPDGHVTRRRAQLDERLSSCVRSGDLVAAPWRHDGHPDHDACGESAFAIGRETGAQILGYLVWTWHWADPDSSEIPWTSCRRLDLSRHASARKRWATAAFRSQTQRIGLEVADEPVLPAPLMRRFWRNYEVYVDEEKAA
jgi:LmbE family N-acetylglucosaminyl deacetylase